MKVALVYDRVNKWGGAERVVVALRKIFPDAPLFTSVHKQDKASWAKKIPVTTSFLQKIPFSATHHEALGTFMPAAFESFKFDEFDLVISITSEAAKGIITKPGTRHISIILTPTRYLWSGYNDYFKDELFQLATLPVVAYLRFWDKIAARRPDKLIAISETVKRRIKRYYDLESEVIYPPLMIRSRVFSIQYPVSGKKNTQYSIQDTGYYLVVSRLVPYKRVDIAVGAATKLGLPLKVIGTGNEMKKLKQMARRRPNAAKALSGKQGYGGQAGSNIEFLDYVTDAQLKEYYANCRALIFPGVEDFGLTMVEAQAFGKPVIAFRGGGAEEIIIEHKTGEFFDKQNAQSLVDVLKKFRPSRYNIKDCKKNASRFSFEKFKRKILYITNEIYA